MRLLYLLIIVCCLNLFALSLEDRLKKLLARTHVNNWEQAKAGLEENYSVRRTLGYYAHKAFNSKQRPNETANGAHKWIPFAETYRGQRVNIWRTSRGQVKNARAEVI